MTIEKDIDELITGYFTQELTTEELATLRQWITVSADNKAHFMKMQEIWFASISANDAFRFDSERAFQRFLARKTAAEEDNTNSEKTITLKPSRSIGFYLWRVAAAVAVLVMFAGAGYRIGKTGDKKLLADVSVEAPAGSISKLLLPDGSTVWLKPSSKIVYSNNFGTSSRNIKLEGEAFFEVTKNKKLPFSVTSNNMNVNVLGTKFNFKNYANENTAQVTLVEGKVSFSNTLQSDKNYTLLPNQQISFDKTTNQVSVKDVNAGQAADWQKGVLFFDEEKLSDIVKKLERCYNVEIKITDEALSSYRFYGTFNYPEQSIGEVLSTLAATKKIKYKIEGNKVLLNAK